MSKDWFGLVKILELQHWRNGEVIYEQRNLRNLLHANGEEFLLRAAFLGGRVSTVIPDDYYLGLDNRSVISAEDTMAGLIGEPSSSGYVRQVVASSGDFGINFEEDHWQVTSPIVAFRAQGGSWGPVSNLFLTDQVTNSGFLISSVALESAIEVDNGDSVTMRLGMLLKDCPDTT